jgi:hypothetical protein
MTILGSSDTIKSTFICISKVSLISSFVLLTSAIIQGQLFR